MSDETLDPTATVADETPSPEPAPKAAPRRRVAKAKTPWDKLKPGWYLLGCRPIVEDGRITVPLPYTRFEYGGQSFPFECADENPRKTGAGEYEYNQVRHGQRVWLDAEAIEELARAYRVSAYSPSTRSVSRVDRRGFRSRASDIAIERFLYCVSCDEPTAGPMRQARLDADERRAASQAEAAPDVSGLPQAME